MQIRPDNIGEECKEVEQEVEIERYPEHSQCNSKE